MDTKSIAVIGATSLIAQHCLRLWLQDGSAQVTLAGRDAARLGDVAADLRVRFPQSTIEVLAFDLLDPAAIETQVERMCAAGAPAIVLVAHGVLPDQAACQGSAQQASDALAVNAVSPVLFAEAFARRLDKAGGGTLVVLGSVAGDRGRKKNYVYGAAKALVDRYCEGLQHRFAGSRVKVVLAKPGPTDTPMTAHLPRAGLASAESVARSIVRGVQHGRPVVYAPSKWRWIMLVIRHLPRFVFDKLDI
jgi:short-subunit dehydrogenase